MARIFDNRGAIKFLLIIGIILVFGVIGGVGYVALDQYRADQIDADERRELAAELERLRSEGNSEIELLKKELEVLRNQKPEVVIQKVVREVPNQSTKPDLASIVSQWTPRIANVTCQFSLKDYQSKSLFEKFKLSTETEIGSGSGFLMEVTDTETGGSSIAVMTNAHVLAGHNGFSSPDFCDVTLSDSTAYHIEGGFDNIQYFDLGEDSDIEFVNDIPYISHNSDVGILVIPNPSESTRQIASEAFRCSATPQIGDDVVVLGNPSSTSGSVTAREGIISSTESSFFMTQIGLGIENTGGAAISEKNNCYFGIPTYYANGEDVSNVRVLDIGTVIGG